MLRYTADLRRAGTAGGECIIQCCTQKYLLDSVGGDSTLYRWGRESRGECIGVVVVRVVVSILQSRYRYSRLDNVHIFSTTMPIRYYYYNRK